MLLIPFANPIPPPSTDRTITGALHAMTPATVSPAALSTAASPANTLLLFGDNTSGVVQWNDETTDANSQLNSDTPVFNSDGDQYYLDMGTNDVIESLDWYISAAGTYTATVTATVAYRDLTGALVQQAGLAMPSMTTTGIKRLMLSSVIDVANVGLADDPRDPSATRRKALFVKFSVTGGTVTTAPLAQRFWKRRTLAATKAVTDFTALVGTGDKTPFLPVTTLALNGDLTLEGMDAKSATGFVTITRSREAGLLSELVYSKGAGVFGTIPAADLYITSGISGNDELWQAAAGQYVDAWIPPTDWVKDTITVGVTAHNKYWFGWRVTQDTPAPSLVPLVELRNGLLAGATVSGVASLEAATYTKFELFARTATASEVWLVLSNKRTEQTVSVKLAANATYASSAISFPVLVGDDVVVQVIRGGQFFNAADGFIRLS